MIRTMVFKQGPWALLVGALVILGGCSRSENPIAPVPTTIPASPMPSPSQLVASLRYVVRNGQQLLMPSPRQTPVPGYGVAFDFITVSDINNNADDQQQWDVVGSSAAVQRGNGGGSITFEHTVVQLPAGSRVEHRSMALHAFESDARTYDIPSGYRGWVLVSAGRSYLPMGASDFSFSSATGRVGQTLVAVGACGFGLSNSTVLFDVYFVLVPEDSDFDLVPEQALVMYNARTATVPAPPGSFAIWQDYSTSSSEISAAILSAELQKKLRELVPDHFAAGGALGKHAGVSVTPAQIGALISWAKQLWNLGVFLVKFINGNPRDDDASFRVTRSATHWSGRGVDGNDYSRATMLIYRVKVGAN